MLERLARACYVRRRFVLIGWIVLVVGLSMLGSALSQEFRTSFDLPGSDSQAATDLLEDAGFGNRGTQLSGQIVFTSPDGVRTPAVRSSMRTHR